MPLISRKWSNEINISFSPTFFLSYLMLGGFEGVSVEKGGRKGKGKEARKHSLIPHEVCVLGVAGKERTCHWGVEQRFKVIRAFFQTTSPLWHMVCILHLFLVENSYSFSHIQLKDTLFAKCFLSMVESCCCCCHVQWTISTLFWAGCSADFWTAVCYQVSQLGIPGCSVAYCTRLI